MIRKEKKMNIYDQIYSQIAQPFEMGSVEVSYVSRRLGTRTLKVFPAGVQWNDIEKVNSGYGLSSSRDYIARSSDFPEGSRPEHGDRIEEGGNVWKVYPLDEEACWRRLGNERIGFIRIHTHKTKGE